MKTKVLVRVIVVLLIMVVFGREASAYNLRLMAMGDMEGIIEARDDYERIITEINNNEGDFASGTYLNNCFNNNFPENNVPSSLIYDLQRKGIRDAYEINFVRVVNPKIGFGLHYLNEARDYRSSYIDSGGDMQLLVRQGRGEVKTIVAGWKVVDWLDLVVAYDDTLQTDVYRGVETSSGEVSIQEATGFKGLSYGFKTHNEDWWLSFSMGDSHETKLSYEAESSYGEHTTLGPGRMSFLIGRKIWDGKAKVNYGYFARRVGIESQFNSLLGMQYAPDDGIVLGGGLKTLGESDQNGDYRKISVNIGGEMTSPNCAALKLRAGIISKTLGVLYYRFADSLIDYSLGLGYVWNSFVLDFLYYNYQGIPGGTYKWATCPTGVMNFYMYTPTNERNAIYAVSVTHEI